MLPAVWESTNARWRGKDLNQGRANLKEVIAFIRPDKWQVTRDTASALGAEEIMHWRVLGRGRQRGLRYLRPLPGGEEWGMQFLPSGWPAGS